MTFAATILTLYPDMFPGPLGVSLAARARAEGKWTLECVQIRDFAIGKHKAVDDTPAGCPPAQASRQSSALSCAMVTVR